MCKSLTVLALALFLALPLLASDYSGLIDSEDGINPGLYERQNPVDHLLNKKPGNPVDSLSGSYDIGGGNNDYPNLFAACNDLSAYGVSGPVIMNIYPGTYNTQTPHLIGVTGVDSVNTITIRGIADPSGQRPIISNTTGTGYEGGSGIWIDGVDYVTVENLEIANCNGIGIWIYYNSTDTSDYCKVKNNYFHDCGLDGAHCMWAARARHFELSGNEMVGGLYSIYMYYDTDALVYNNMMMLSTYSRGPIGTYQGVNSRLYYNSIYNSYGIYAAWLRYNAGCDYRNNIFYSDMPDGQCVYFSGDLPSTCDYNCIWAPNGAIGYYGGIQQTMLEWQTATGLDANSINADPRFIGYTDYLDLHIRSYMQSPVDSAATPIAGFTVDIDGDQRDAAYPDIGADEFVYNVPDRGVTIVPHLPRWQAGSPSEVLNYHYNITNIGSNADTYNLTVSGASWPTTVYDSSGTTAITSTNNLAFLDNQWVMVAHTIPAGTPGGSVDTGYLVVTSQAAPTVADSGMFSSRCAVMSGSFDVGGGANDFATIVQAIDTLYFYGMAESCTLNVYTGTYPGGVVVGNDLPGLGNGNALIMQAAPGQIPRVTNTVLSGGSGISLRGVGYVTIQGFEIDSCNGNGISISIAGTDSSEHIYIKDNYIHGFSIEGYAYGVYYSGVTNGEITGNEIAGGYMGTYCEYSQDFILANNMVYDQSYSMLWIRDGGNCTLCYNSTIMLSLGSYSYGYYISNMYGTNINNNILVNLSSGTNHRGYYMRGLTGGMSDYNCIYVPNGTFGYFNGYVYSLTEWQTASSMDLNSISVDPYYVSGFAPFDLHLTDSSACIGAGTPVAGITVDFDGDLRNPNTPCIGADELYTDLGVTLTPHNPPIQIPANGGSFTFDVEITNHSNAPIVFDGWTMTILPNGVPFGPLVLRTNLTIQPGQTIMRIVTQNVPGQAPPGIYTYIGNAGVYPDSIVDYEQFNFEKIAGDGAPIHNKGWLVEGWFGDEAALLSTPTQYDLSAAFPNPFNPTTQISFALPQAGHVLLTVFDVTGREVATLVDGKLPIGHHSVVFDGEGLASGIYFYKLKAAGFTDTKKMALVK